MDALRAYKALLRLYPADYRDSFDAEMANAFERMAEEHRTRGKAAYAGFATAELASLVVGSVAEWIAKATTDSTVRGRSLPDLRKMRPAGVPRETWFAPAARASALPDEVEDAQGRVKFLVDRMVQAIASHDFEGARSFSFEEQKERDNLRRLRAKYNIAE